MRESGDLLLQDRELSRVHRQVVEKEGIDEDPSDREQTEKSSVSRRCQGQLGRHVIDADGQKSGGDESSQGSQLGPDMSEGQQSQEYDHWNGGDECGKRQAPQWIVILRPDHGARGWERFQWVQGSKRITEMISREVNWQRST